MGYIQIHIYEFSNHAQLAVILTKFNLLLKKSNMLKKQKCSRLNLLPFLQALIIIHLPCVISSSGCSTKIRAVIFNFGDSNSDTGGLTAGLGLEADHPYGRAFFDPPTGRESDGRLVIDFLCEYLNTHYLSPYLDSLQPNFTNGVNYATCGAATLPIDKPFNLNVQIRQFKHFLNYFAKLRAQGLKSYVGEIDLKNALYTIDIGQNDLSGSFRVLSYTQVIGKIPSFISEIRDAMWAIYSLGGRNFWVHNTGPLGCLPQELVIHNNVNSSEYDEYGCIKTLNEAAKVFNNQLTALCRELRSQMKNAVIVYVDVYSIKYDLFANAAHYGFKNPLMACCGYGGAPYNYNPEFKLTCLGSDYTVCDKGTKYVSWDGTHYTEAANAIIASKILSTRYSTPPFQFDFFCNPDKISAD